MHLEKKRRNAFTYSISIRSDVGGILLLKVKCFIYELVRGKVRENGPSGRRLPIFRRSHKSEAHYVRTYGVGLELFIIWNGATAHHLPTVPYNKADLIAVSDIPGN